MKTIEESAKGDWLKVLPDSAVNIFFSIGYEKGVEFAQRWIPVEEELPEFGNRVLIKTIDGLIGFGFTNHRGIINYEDEDTSCMPKITHWRLIELK